MSRYAVTQASRVASRALRSSQPVCRASARLAPTTASHLRRPSAIACRRFLSSSTDRNRGIMPDTENPSRPTPAETPETYSAVELSDAKYHELADEYLDKIVLKFEEIQDSRAEVDVEFSSGVLTVSFPEQGTYVVNKQPPNKQIWLSSPISGPKRYDWCVVGEGQADKGDTAEGDWIYSRDNTNLSKVFLEELGVDVDVPPEDQDSA